MTCVVSPGRVDGTLAAPSSKSVTHRAYLLAAQSEVACRVDSPLQSGDTDAMLACLTALGAAATVEAGHVGFTPRDLHAPRDALDCGNSGTALRLLTATVARLADETRLTGDASLRSRPNASLLHALTRLGASISDAGDGRAPLRVRGPIRAGSTALPRSVSSQFTSALLLSLPFLEGDSALELEGQTPSRPYVDLTLGLARAAGLRRGEPGGPQGGRFLVPGAQRVTTRAIRVEGDWSGAAFPLAAAAVTGGCVAVTGLDAASLQGDRAIVPLLRRFGARVTAGAGQVSCEGGPLVGVVDLDVSQTPDLFPVLAVVAACARGTTRLTGGAALRHKETDRIRAMSEGLRAMGIRTREHPDGLEVTGGPLAGAPVDAQGDHRIHMAFVVAGLAAQGRTTVTDAGSAVVSYPRFHRDLGRLGGRLGLDAVARLRS
ncbi:MAG TPA: 3-phosphoshikimate 1-carboxyvinyltransferase [Candidatus Thermoplasmatota archaeon]|nr:3-phosphoshikimate 1-carboxyvinyltransferase [Candidatus Thermoplasmatota archaeon]